MTFYISPIRSHNLKIVNNMGIEMCFLGNMVMNEIMGATIVN
jgi:hypothetical protein